MKYESADNVRYDVLCSIVDKVKMDERQQDTDVYASAIQQLFINEIRVLREQQVTDEIRNAMKDIVIYGWADEHKDFCQQYQEDPANTEGHAFRRLVTLSNWVDGTSFLPESFLADD
jgi:hypothetical protein